MLRLLLLGAFLISGTSFAGLDWVGHNVCDEGPDKLNPVSVTNDRCIRVVSGVGVMNNWGALDAYEANASATFCDPDGEGGQPNEPNKDSCRSRGYFATINSAPEGAVCIEGAFSHPLIEQASGSIYNPLRSNATSGTAAHGAAIFTSPLAAGSTLSTFDNGVGGVAVVGADFPDLSQICNSAAVPGQTLYSSNAYVMDFQLSDTLLTVAWEDGEEPSDPWHYMAVLLQRMMYSLINPDGTSDPVGSDDLIQYIDLPEKIICSYRVGDTLKEAVFQSRWAGSLTTYVPGQDRHRKFGHGRRALFGETAQQMVSYYFPPHNRINIEYHKAPEVIEIPANQPFNEDHCRKDVGNDGLQDNDIAYNKKVFINESPFRTFR